MYTLDVVGHNDETAIELLENIVAVLKKQHTRLILFIGSEVLVYEPQPISNRGEDAP